MIFSKRFYISFYFIYFCCMSVEQLIMAFEKDCLVRGYASRTVESYVGHVRVYLESFSFDSGFDEFRDFLVYIRDRQGFTLATVNHYFSSLSVFYDYLEFEGMVDRNEVPRFRKRYLRNYKKMHVPEPKQLITVEQMAQLVDAPERLGYKAMIIFLAKTGIRRNELITLDIEDVSFDDNTALLKPTAKRSNRVVFFDDECKAFLGAYLQSRADVDSALFVGRQGRRIRRNQVYGVVTKYAQECGFHNSGGQSYERFGPHCCRHWFTTWLRRGGMSRPFIQMLRGDSMDEAIDFYDHVEIDELKEAYMKYIPKLGVFP